MDGSDGHSSRCCDDCQEDTRRNSRGQTSEDRPADQLSSLRGRRKHAGQHTHVMPPPDDDDDSMLPQEADPEFQQQALGILLDIDQAVNDLEREDLKIRSLHLHCQAEIRKFRVRKRMFANHLRILAENYQNQRNNDKIEHPTVVRQTLINKLQATLSELKSAEETRRKFMAGDLLLGSVDSNSEASGASSSQGLHASHGQKGDQVPPESKDPNESHGHHEESRSQEHELPGECERSIQALQISLDIAQVLSSLERGGLEIRSQRKKYEDKIRNFTRVNMILANELIPFLEGMRIQTKHLYTEDPLVSTKRQKTEK